MAHYGLNSDIALLPGWAKTGSRPPSFDHSPIRLAKTQALSRYRELLDGGVMSVTGFEGFCGAEEGGVSAGRLLVVVAVDI